MLGKEERNRNLSLAPTKLQIPVKTLLTDTPGLNIPRQSKAGTGVPANLK